MPDLSNTFVQWLLSQAEGLPAELLREIPGSPAMDRLISAEFASRESAHLRAILDMPEGADRQACTILIPGIMGSLLASTRGISSVLWLNPSLLMGGYLNLLDLDEGGESDASPDVDIVPIGIEKMTYLRMIQTLARHSRLYEFPYDWRKSIFTTAQQLHDAIERWSVASPARRYTFVCHSMGGLVARAYLALYPEEAEQRIERLIMVGVPLQGAAIAALTFNPRLHPFLLVANLHEHNDLVRFSRSLPSVYQLLPPPEDLFSAAAAYPFDWDVYDATAWPATPVRQDFLDSARTLHEAIAGSDPQLPMVNFAGCNRPTVTAVRRSADPDTAYEPSYDESEGSGDEQVPFWSARASNVITYYLEENHNALVSNDNVLADIVAVLRGETPALPTAPPPARAALSRHGSLSLLQQVSEFRERIENGTLSRVDLDRLFFWR